MTEKIRYQYPAGCILEHDVDCSIFRTGECDCDPNVSVIDKDGNTRWIRQMPFTVAKDEPKVKPCPWCGGADIDYRWVNGLAGGRTTAAECQRCGARGPGIDPNTPVLEQDSCALELWNKRAGG